MCIKKNISKLIFARQPTSLSMGKTHEKSPLFMVGFTIGELIPSLIKGKTSSKTDKKFY